MMWTCFLVLQRPYSLGHGHQDLNHCRAMYVIRIEQWEQQAELEEATEGRTAEMDHNRASSPDLGLTKSKVMLENVLRQQLQETSLPLSLRPSLRVQNPSHPFSMVSIPPKRALHGKCKPLLCFAGWLSGCKLQSVCKLLYHNIIPQYHNAILCYSPCLSHSSWTIWILYSTFSALFKFLPKIAWDSHTMEPVRNSKLLQ